MLSGTYLVLKGAFCERVERVGTSQALNRCLASLLVELYLEDWNHTHPCSDENKHAQMNDAWFVAFVQTPHAGQRGRCTWHLGPSALGA